MKKTGTIIVFIFVLCLVVATIYLRIKETEESFYLTQRKTHLTKEEQNPAQFERYLEQHPEDETYREAALKWYSREEKDFEGLKRHTFEMIEYHPFNVHLLMTNARAFSENPEYVREVVNRLEEKVVENEPDHQGYYLLALICKQGVFPQPFTNGDDKEWFCDKYGSATDEPVLTEAEQVMAHKAVTYFQSAISHVTEKDDPYFISYYTEQLADLLCKMGEAEEAVELCEKILPTLDEDDKPDFLNTYATCLLKIGNREKAKEVFQQVRESDHEGHKGGAGHATACAETMLGLMALEQGDKKEAVHWLLSSCDIEPCSHILAQGFPLLLARRLLEQGEADYVTRFCETVLENVTKEDEDVEALYSQAQAMQESGIGKE